MPNKTLRKCSGCHTLIEVCDKTPPTARRFCTACMAQKLVRGCVSCGKHAGRRNRLHWFGGDFRCSAHLNSEYRIGEPQTRRCSSLEMTTA